MTLELASEKETAAFAEKLAEQLQKNQPVFLQLKGPVGAGKTTFARAFIQTWLSLENQKAAESISSPTFNLVRTYGNNTIAHFDLYRMKEMEELEQIGFEQYFYEFPCCIVEWLEQVSQAEALAPAHRILVELSFSKNQKARQVRIEGLKAVF